MEPGSVPAGDSAQRTPVADADTHWRDDDATALEPAGAELDATRVLDASGQSLAPEPTQASSPEDTQATAPSKRKGVSTLGDYRLLKKVGEGAMGTVYKARQLSFDRDVALKVLFPHIANIPKLVERLYREGRIMGQLDHPNIVQAYGIGEDQGWHYVALEYVDGLSLHQWLDRLGRFSVGDAMHITLAIAKALAYAHGIGVVHRDIKPDNVLIGKDGAVKVVDLGMVKRLEEDMALTATGHAVGTPWYMPLEQAKNSKDADGRSDIYALGCLFYCLLVGHPPFSGKTLIEVIQAKNAGTFPPAHKFNIDVPERLDLLIAKMTAKLPKYRQQTCAELVKDLESLNLANEALEFIHGPATPPPQLGDSSAALVRPLDPNLWYVRVKGAQGQAVLKKMTTSHIQKMLENGRLEPTAKASHSHKEGFRALAAIKEFEAAALARASKKATDAQAGRYRNLYKQIEEKELSREEERRSSVSTLGYWWGIFWRCAVVAGGVGGAIYFFYWVVSGLAGTW